MKDMNWVVGVKRLYLVVWVVWFAISIYGFIHDAGLSLWGIFLIGVFGIGIPYAILKAGQWIYAGMQTKQQ